MTNLAQQKWLADPRLARLFKAIEQAGGEARIAGGAVRNGLWGLPVKDIDVATTLLPDEVMAAGKEAAFSVHPTGHEHGTITVVVEGLSIEVTTLRADMETDGRRAVVAYTTDWAVDAWRRDFTFNALYCDLTGKVYDETGSGLKDGAARRVRFVGNAEERIGEDYLRILRYFRFEAQYGKGPFDDQALRACGKLKAGLKGLSVERIQAEVFKTLAAPRAVAVIEVMIAKGILGQLIDIDGRLDKLALLVGLEQQLDVAPDALRRLAMLTSDVRHLRLSRLDQQRFAALKTTIDISPHMAENKKANKNANRQEPARQKLLYELGQDGYHDAVIMAWVTACGRPDDADWLELYNLPDHWPVPVFPLTGKDLIADGFLPGKDMGKVLKLLERQWIADGFCDEKPALLKKAVEYKK